LFGIHNRQNDRLTEKNELLTTQVFSIKTPCEKNSVCLC